MDDSSSFKDSVELYFNNYYSKYLGDDEYGDYPKLSLWWEEDYDPPDYAAYISYDDEYNFDWDYVEGGI